MNVSGQRRTLGAEPPAPSGCLIAAVEALSHPKSFCDAALVLASAVPRLAKEARPFDRLRAGRGAPQRFAASRCPNQLLKVSGAKAGMERWAGIPAMSLVRSRRNGSWVVRLTRPGA